VTTSSPIPGETPTAHDKGRTPLVDRDLLHLRPTVYPEADGHPDARPCPSWCWAAQGVDRQHEIEAAHPLTAEHHIDQAIATVASLYPGESAPGASPGHLRTATIESDLAQLGTAEPVIRINLRSYRRHTERHQNRLTLSLADATELAAVLTHLVNLGIGNARA
jgi:hypothetical protein